MFGIFLCYLSHLRSSPWVAMARVVASCCGSAGLWLSPRAHLGLGTLSRPDSWHPLRSDLVALYLYGKEGFVAKTGSAFSGCAP